MAPRTPETSSRGFDCQLRPKRVILRRASGAETATKLALGTDGVMQWLLVSFTPEHSGFFRLLRVIMNLVEATAEGYNFRAEMHIQSF